MQIGLMDGSSLSHLLWNDKLNDYIWNNWEFIFRLIRITDDYGMPVLFCVYFYLVPH